VEASPKRLTPPSLAKAYAYRKEKEMAGAEDMAENPAGEERRYYHPVQKDYTTFLETSEETGGEHTLLEIELAPGGGNTPHYHKTHDEHFEVVEGTLEVLVGKETRVLRPGQKAVAPRNTLHKFRNPGEERARFLVELRPASAGFEKATKAGYGLARRSCRCRRDPEEPLPSGGAPGMVRDTVARRLHHRRAAAPVPGEEGPAEGDRPGAGGEIL